MTNLLTILCLLLLFACYGITCLVGAILTLAEAISRGIRVWGSVNSKVESDDDAADWWKK